MIDGKPEACLPCLVVADSLDGNRSEGAEGRLQHFFVEDFEAIGFALLSISDLVTQFRWLLVGLHEFCNVAAQLVLQGKFVQCAGH